MHTDYASPMIRQLRDRLVTVSLTRGSLNRPIVWSDC